MEKKAAFGKKTLNSYFLGLGLSLIFTFLSFWLVGHHVLATPNLYVAITIFAILQLLAQVIFFLRLNMGPEGQSTSISFIFVLFVVLILVAGSLWIMYNLSYFMVH